VQIDNTMMQAARYYSQIMFELNVLSHNIGPYATNPTAEHGASGNVARAFGANVSWGGGNGAFGQRTPENLVEGWMNSPGHRRYIVSPEHRFIGVGRTGLYTYMFLSDTASSDAPPPTIDEHLPISNSPLIGAWVSLRVENAPPNIRCLDRMTFFGNGNISGVPIINEIADPPMTWQHLTNNRIQLIGSNFINPMWEYVLTDNILTIYYDRANNFYQVFEREG
jgi:hypothetical protein